MEETTPQEQQPQEGITADAVASKNEPPAAPDVSVVADRYNAQAAKPQDGQKDEYARLKEELEWLQRLRAGVPKEQEQTKKTEAKDDLIAQLQSRLDEISTRQENWEEQLRRQREQAQYESDLREVSLWVSENEQEFPLINKIGQQGIVFQKMYNTRSHDGRMMSEAAAAREVESELRAIVEQCAPALGYQKSQSRAEGEEQVNLTSDLSVGSTVDRGKMSDDEYLNYLIAQHQGQ